MLDCIRWIEQYVSVGREQFLVDHMRLDAVVRNLQTIVEASKQIPDEVKGRYRDVDWKALIGFRNVAVHEYLEVNPHTVWDIVENDLPKLKGAVEAMSKEAGL